MKITLFTIIASLFLIAGCGKKEGDGHEGHDHAAHEGHDHGSHAGHDHSGHDHAGHDHSGHDHGDHEEHEDGHAHHHHDPPHGGSLNVLGNELAHVEIVHDKATGSLTCYVLGRDAQAGVPVRVKELPMTATVNGKTFDLVLASQANELAGETVGNSSQFAVTDDRLKGLDKFGLTLKEIKVKGIRFSDVDMPFPEGNEAH